MEAPAPASKPSKRLRISSVPPQNGGRRARRTRRSPCPDARRSGPLSDEAVEEFATAKMKTNWPVCFGANYSTTVAPFLDNVERSSVDGCDRATLYEQELFAWPQRIVSKHIEVAGKDCGQSVVEKLEEIRRKGVCVTTHYSGMGTAEDAAEYALTFGAQAAGLPSDIPFAAYSASDSSAPCRQVLIRNGKAQHIFGDILDRLDSSILDALKSTLQAHISRFYESVEELGNGASEDDGSAMGRKGLLDEIGRQWCAEAKRILQKQNFSDKTTAWCFKCKRSCPCFPSKAKLEDMLFIEISGTTCTAWSSMNQSALGWLDVSSIACLTWCRMVQCLEPHIVIHECVPRFDSTMLSKHIGSKYAVESCIFTPVQLGFPSNRNRRYTVCMLVGRRHDDFHECSLRITRPYAIDTFREVAFRDLRVDCRVYLQAGKERQHQVYISQATKKHLPGEWCLAQKFSWIRLMGRGDRRRLAEWGVRAAALALSAGSSTAATATESDRGNPFMCVNAQQNASFAKARHTNIMPTLMRGSRIYVCTPDFAWRPCLAEELLCAQGLPMFGGAKAASPLAQTMNIMVPSLEIAETQICAFAGNSMHHAAVGSVFLDCLLRVVIDP